jgi:S1-C subfamily serine protease/Flp pilus assembly protein TadD
LATGCSAVDFTSIAAAQVKAGRYDQAIAAAMQATQTAPNYAPGWYWLGLSYSRNKQHAEAIQAFQKFFALNPTGAQVASAYQSMGYSYNELKKYDLAIPLLKRAVELEPKNRVSSNNLGYVYLQTRQYDLAVVNLRRALELDPIDQGGISNYLLGLAYYRQGEYTSAAQAFERARDLGNANATSGLELARAAVAQPGIVGMELNVRDDVLTVVESVTGGPARRAGILSDDRIVKIDGLSTKGMTIGDVVKRLRGAPGTRVTLSVARDGWTSPRDIEIVRALQRVASAPVTPSPAPQEPPRAPRQAEASAPVASAGSGFLLRNTNLVLTNHHVVANRTHITVTFPSGEQYPGRVAYRDTGNDLAIIEIQGRPVSGGLVLAVAEKIQVGDTVHALGYPLGPGLSRQPSLVSGEISSTLGMGDDIARFRTTAPINPGNSGGPLVNQRGQVIGIAAAGLVRRDVEAIRFGIKASTATLILQQAQVQTAFDVVVSPTAPATKSATQIFADISQYVVLNRNPVEWPPGFESPRTLQTSPTKS